MKSLSETLPRINTRRHPDDRTAVANLMQDGKERTAEDVANRLRIATERADGILREMVRRHKLLGRTLRKQNEYVFKLPKGEGE